MKRYITATRIVTVYDDERQPELILVYDGCARYIADAMEDSNKKEEFLGEYGHTDYNAVYDTFKAWFNAAGFNIGKDIDTSGIGNNSNYAIYYENVDGNTIEECVCGFFYLTIDPYGPVHVGISNNKNKVVSKKYQFPMRSCVYVEIHSSSDKRDMGTYNQDAEDNAVKFMKWLEKNKIEYYKHGGGINNWPSIDVRPGWRQLDKVVSYAKKLKGLKV